MPVFIEYPVQLSQQDQTDLQLIYADLPPEIQPPFDSVEQLLAAAQQQRLVVARFNGRLLAAAVLCKDGDGWQMSHLCVRGLTRQRGVAQRLLSEVSAAASDNAVKLSLHLVAAPDWVPAWLAREFPALTLINC